MSIRHNILAAIAQDGATMDDICDRLNQPRKKLHDNVKSCVTDGLVIRGRDDITGLPFYTLTAAGRARLAEGPGVGGRKPSMTTQPEEVKITGSAASVASSEAPLRLSAEGCAVIEPPKQGDVPAEAGSDEIKPPQYDPRKVSFNPSDRALSIAIRNHNLIDEICTVVGFDDNLPLENLSAFIADRISSSTALKQKDDELFKQAQIVANLRREVESLTAALNQAKRRQTSGVGDKYMLLYPDDKLFDTPEQAATAALDCLTDSEIEDTQIIAVNPIGRIEVRTVFVPHADNYQEAA